MPIKSTKIKIVSLLVLNILVWGFYTHAFIQIKIGETKMLLLENEMKDNLRRQEMALILSKSLDDTETDRQKIIGNVIPKEGEVDFIKNTEDLVAKNNLKSEIKDVKIEPIQGIGSLENLAIKLDVVGAWSDVMAFENLLERYPAVLSIESFTLNKFDTYNVKGKQIPQWLGSFSFKLAKIKE